MQRLQVSGETQETIKKVSSQGSINQLWDTQCLVNINSPLKKEERIFFHFVCPKGYGIHYNTIHSWPIIVWMRLDYKLTSWHSLGDSKEKKTRH